MKTEQISLVLAIARDRSLSRAAKALFISQPTASNMLRSLEKELGYPLFERAKSGMVLTDEGLEFIEYARAIDRSLESIAQIRRPIRRIDFRVLSLKLDRCERAFELLCKWHVVDGLGVNLQYQVVANTLDAARMIENGNGDVAVALCREGLYESVYRDAKRRGLTTVPIDVLHLEMTCAKEHPIVSTGTIAYDLLSEYTAFTSIDASDSEIYVPQSLGARGIRVPNRIVMDPCPTRYRLLCDTSGYLVSIPVSNEVKAEYGLVSLPIEDSSITMFAMHRSDPQKKDFIDEYIRACAG